MLNEAQVLTASAPERLAWASSPATPPELLERLAGDGNLRVRRAAANHPAVPVEVIDLLRRAGATDDLAGFTPSDQALSADDFQRLIKTGEWGRRLAAAHRDAKTEVLEALATDAVLSVRRCVAMNPNASPAVLEPLCGDSEASVRRAAAQNPRVAQTVIEGLVAAGSKPDLSGWVALKDLPEGKVEFDAIVACGIWGKRLTARHPRADADRLRRLANDADWSVRAAVAENPSADAATLASLADLDRFEVKLKVASHPQTSGDILLKLAAEFDTRLRVAVASNPNACRVLLRRLACDGASVVREAVAGHGRFLVEDRDVMVAAGSTSDLMGFSDPASSLSAQILDHLAAWGDWGKRLAARHPNTTPDTLAQLLTAGDPMLREAALAHPRRPKAVINTLTAAGSHHDLQGFAQPNNGSIGIEAAEQLVSLGPWARRLLSRHPDADTVVLADLADDPDPQTRREVARHPRTDGPTLTQLAGDVGHEVRWTLVNRTSLPAEALDQLLHDPLATIRRAAVDHPDTPSTTLAALKFDLDEDVRAAVRARLG